MVWTTLGTTCTKCYNWVGIPGRPVWPHAIPRGSAGYKTVGEGMNMNVLWIHLLKHIWYLIWSYVLILCASRFNLFRYWHSPVWEDSDTFRPEHPPVLKDSYIFKFWHFLVLKDSDIFLFEKILTFSDPKILRFWKILTFSDSDIFWFWRILTFSDSDIFRFCHIQILTFSGFDRNGF